MSVVLLSPILAHAANSPLNWVAPPLPVRGTVERIVPKNNPHLLHSLVRNVKLQDTFACTCGDYSRSLPACLMFSCCGSRPSHWWHSFFTNCSSFNACAAHTLYFILTAPPLHPSSMHTDNFPLHSSPTYVHALIAFSFVPLLKHTLAFSLTPNPSHPKSMHTLAFPSPKTPPTLNPCTL